jgi:hypothetical protein
MIFNKDRMARLSGLMTEAKDGSEKAKAMAGNFGGGELEDEQFLSGEVTTEAAHEEAADVDEADADMEEEKAVREMVKAELDAAKEEIKRGMKEEQAVREAVRKEIRSVLRSRGVTLGGTGFGFKR